MPEPNAPRALRRRLPPLIRRSAVPLVVLLAGGLVYYWVVTAPYRTMRQFLAAVEQRNTVRMYLLTDPREKSELNVTAEGLASAFGSVFDTPVRRGAIRTEASHRREVPGGVQYEWGVFWLDASGRPLSGARHPRTAKREQTSSLLIARHTPEGWRMATCEFLRSTCLTRWGGRGPYITVARRARIRGAFNGRNKKISLDEEFWPGRKSPNGDFPLR